MTVEELLDDAEDGGYGLPFTWRGEPGAFRVVFSHYFHPQRVYVCQGRLGRRRVQFQIAVTPAGWTVQGLRTSH